MTIRIALVLSLISVALAQGRPATLSGTVSKIDGGPLSKATVEVRTGSSAVYTVTSDSEGRFLFSNLSPGQYRLSAKRPGYVPKGYGQRQPEDPVVPLTLASGQNLQGIRLEMTAGGVISGRVLDRGRPTALVNVFALKATYDFGQRVMKTVLSAQTNDLGEYHIFWLPPGRYYLMANVYNRVQAGSSSVTIDVQARDTNDPLFLDRNGGSRLVLSKTVDVPLSETETHVPIFFPNTPDWRQATMIDVAPGAEIRNADINARPAPSVHVRGTVSVGASQTNQPGGQRGNPSVALTPIHTSIAATSSATATVQPDGSFDISKVSPGSYLLIAALGPMRGKTSVDVRESDVTTSITLAPGLNLTGRVIVERPTPIAADPVLPALAISLVADPLLANVPPNAIFTAPVARPAATGSFTIPANANGAGPSIGDYRVVVGPILLPPMSASTPVISLLPALRPGTPVAALEKAYVKSITLGSTDVLNDGLHLTGQPNDPLVIVVGLNPGTIEGRVVNALRQPSQGTPVVLIPQGGLRFHTNHRYAFTDAEGRFQLNNLAPADYLLFAWEDVETGAWQDPDFVRKYEDRGTRVHIEEGKVSAMELTSLP